jgi:hypothetical protein
MNLFKYLNPARIDVMENLMLRFSRPNDFNDPFESYPSLGGIKDLAGEETFYNENIKERFDAIQNESLLKYLPENVKIPEEFKDSYSKMTLGEAAFKICGIDNIFKKVITEYPDKVENQIATVINRNFNNRFGILCLSEKHDNLIMWAHYGQNHEGFVVGFDSKSSYFDQRKNDLDIIRILTKVDYLKERPELVLYNTDKPGYDLAGYLIKYALLTKSIHWIEEQEWRMVVDIRTANVIKENVYLFNFPSSIITSLFLGVKMKPEFKKKIIQTCMEQKIDVPIYEAYRDPKMYEIKFKLIEK